MKSQDFFQLFAKDGEFYFIKICEELSELQTAILHFRQGKVHNENVLEEIADVLIQVEKIVAYLAKFDSYQCFLLEKRVNEIKDMKTKQLEKYIEVDNE